jgi:hypothetical protein
MSTRSDILSAIATALGDVEGITTVAYNRDLVNDPFTVAQLPALNYVVLNSKSFNETLRGARRTTLEVEITWLGTGSTAADDAEAAIPVITDAVMTSAIVGTGTTIVSPSGDEFDRLDYGDITAYAKVTFDVTYFE